MLSCTPPPSPIADVRVKHGAVSGRGCLSPLACRFWNSMVCVAFRTMVVMALALFILYHYSGVAVGGFQASAEVVEP